MIFTNFTTEIIIVHELSHLCRFPADFVQQPLFETIKVNLCTRSFATARRYQDIWVVFLVTQTELTCAFFKRLQVHLLNLVISFKLLINNLFKIIGFLHKVLHPANFDNKSRNKIVSLLWLDDLIARNFRSRNKCVLTFPSIQTTTESVAVWCVRLRHNATLVLVMVVAYVNVAALVHLELLLAQTLTLVIEHFR